MMRGGARPSQQVSRGFGRGRFSQRDFRKDGVNHPELQWAVQWNGDGMGGRPGMLKADMAS
jgi:hypothetical protein